MTDDALLFAAILASVCAAVVLRRAWSLPRRSIAWNGAGWCLFGLGLVLGWIGAGAWGSTVATIGGIGAALLLLAYAAATAPAANGARASNRRVGALPEGREPFRLGRRIVTFLMIVLAAMVVSLGLALATRGVFALGGAGEANANVASFFTMPLAWAVLAFVLLLEEQRARQWRLLAIAAAPGVLAVAAGLAI
ncbi:hypothetical protein ACSBM8_06265 [Sphingomonas sp. ASY06-1R]|uniref:hypothetical protein n=1 Tax=Sphingomonas sp. ASY06-1R TaxID=3445771 RepID=UPI003FA1F794